MGNQTTFKRPQVRKGVRAQGTIKKAGTKSLRGGRRPALTVIVQRFHVHFSGQGESAIILQDAGKSCENFLALKPETSSLLELH